MPRKLCILIAIPTLLVTLLACSGEADIDLPGIRRIQIGRSTAAGVRRLSAVQRAMWEVAILTGNPAVLPAGGFYDPDTGEFSIEVDTTNDGFPDSTLGGFVTSTDDISDGIDPGESADFGWVVSGEVSGAGDTRVTGTGPERYLLAGTAHLFDLVQFDFEVSDIALEFGGSETPLGGSLSYIASSFDLESMDGTLNFDGTERATGTGEFEGEDLTFDVKLDTYQVIFKL